MDSVQATHNVSLPDPSNASFPEGDGLIWTAFSTRSEIPIGKRVRVETGERLANAGTPTLVSVWDSQVGDVHGEAGDLVAGKRKHRTDFDEADYRASMETVPIGSALARATTTTEGQFVPDHDTRALFTQWAGLSEQTGTGEIFPSWDLVAACLFQIHQRLHAMNHTDPTAAVAKFLLGKQHTEFRYRVARTCWEQLFKATSARGTDLNMDIGRVFRLLHEVEDSVELQECWKERGAGPVMVTWRPNLPGARLYHAVVTEMVLNFVVNIVRVDGGTAIELRNLLL